jgi:glucose-6-phosphate 1-dehydrogenase
MIILPRSDAFVFFDATGDLAYKKIFPALQVMLRAGELEMPVIGVAWDSLTQEQLLERARDSLEKNGGIDTEAFAKLATQLQYIEGDYNNPATHKRLKQTLGGTTRPLHYMTIPLGMLSDEGWHDPKPQETLP